MPLQTPESVFQQPDAALHNRPDRGMRLIKPAARGGGRVVPGDRGDEPRLQGVAAVTCTCRGRNILHSFLLKM